MTRFEFGGWHTDAGTYCLNANMFGLHASAHKISGRKKWRNNEQQHTNEAGKKKDKPVKRAASKTTKSCGLSSRDPSSCSRNLVTCEGVQTNLGIKSKRFSKQVELSKRWRGPKRKPNKGKSM